MSVTLTTRLPRIPREDQDADGGAHSPLGRPYPSGPGGGASRRWLVLAWLVMFVVFLVPSFGRQTFDTKLGVNTDPAGFIGRLGYLWNPLSSFGALQDQYVGYLVPMAPFSLVMHVIGVPVWVAERAWMALLTAVAFWGIVRLAEALRIGSPGSRLAAGAAYALWPTFTILIGSTSAAVLPGALLPWVVVPLVRGAGGLTAPVTAAGRSALAVVFMGGVNAASTLASLLLPLLFLLTREPGRRRRTMLVAWLVGVGLAVAWWFLPLLFLAGFGFNFLPFIEQARTTTQTMSATEVLRGAGNWVAYLNFGTPWIPAGWTMVANPLAVAGSALAAATGLAGLARQDLPERRWLTSSLALGATIAMAAYWGSLGGPLSPLLHHLFDGALAPFRNMYKFIPVIAVPLVLGAAHVLAEVRVGHRPGWVRPLTALGVVIALLGLATPHLTGRILQPGSFRAVPGYWTQTADFLRDQAADTHALVIPATAHGQFSWGQPIDDPLEPLATTPWVQRDFVPFGGAGYRTMLDAAEQAFTSGRRVDGLPAFLARAGIRYIVVRNDLDPTQFGYTPPAMVHETLKRSGFRRVAAFGPQLAGGVVAPDAPAQVQGLIPLYPAVEIFQATQPAQRPFGPATLLPASATALVSGGPGEELQLSSTGTLDNRPAILAADAPGGRYDGPLSAVTDGLRRADVNFGLLNRNVSYTYTADETNPPDAADGSGGKQPRQLLPVDGAAHQTVAVLSGAARVTASSYGSWLVTSPEADPVHAFDGDAATFWTEGSRNSPVGQWIRIDFGRALTLPENITVRLLDDGPLRPVPTMLKVTTAAGSVNSGMRRSGAVQTLHLAPGRSSWLQVTIASVDHASPGNIGAGIRDIAIPGVKVNRVLTPPEEPAGRGAASQVFSFTRQTNLPSALGAPDPEASFARAFTSTRPLTPQTARAVAVPGPQLDGLLARLGVTRQSRLAVTVSSQFAGLPQFRGRNLADGSFLTGWVAGETNPTVRMSWNGRRTLDQIVLVPAGGISARPTRIRIVSPDGVREAAVPTSGVVRFPALRTNQVQITFPAVENLTVYNPFVGRALQLPVGLAELGFPALKDLLPTPVDQNATFSLRCGVGPTVTVDGRQYPTAASGKVADLMDFSPVTVRICQPGTDGARAAGQDPVTLAAGRHTITSAGHGPLALSTLTLASNQVTAAATARTMTVRTWDNEHRTVDVAPGAAAYLVVHENAAPGWSATLNGRKLTPVRMDGWQQGYLVPAGAGGRITVSYAPGTIYRIGLVIGGLGLLIVLLLALGLGARFGRDTPEQPQLVRFERSRWVGFAVAGGVLFLVGGPLVLAVPLLALLFARRAGAASWIAFGAFAAAGLIAAASVDRPLVHGNGTFSAVAQACALVALAAVLTPVRKPRTRRRPVLVDGTG